MLSVIGFLLHFNLLSNVAAVRATQNAERPSAVPFATLSNQVPFFKSSQSFFPSGYASLESLQKQQIQKNLAADESYRWNGQSFKKGELRPVLPIHLSQFVIDMATQQRWQVLDVGVENIRAHNLKTKDIRLFSTGEVLSDAFDLGFALTLKDVYLKTTASADARILTTIPQGFRLKPISFENGSFKAHYKDYVGYVSLGESLTKYDLCSMAYSNGKWSMVKRREFDALILADNQKISLNKVEKIMTPDTRGIIASSNQKIPRWSQVEVMKSTRSEWIQSLVKGHGSVWWRAPGDEKATNDFIGARLLDDFIREPISSVSFHPKNPLKGILSSRGVYLTEDGIHWKRIPQFEDFNGPVYYFNDLLIFVGHFRSVDGGKTFENYIQIDKLAQAIENQYGFLPRKLQVSRIETQAPFRIKIEIETGARKIKMESPLFAQEWKAVKI